MRKFDEGEHELERALAEDMDPKRCARSYCNVAIAAARQNNAVKAICLYDAALQLDPQMAIALNNKASMLTHLGRFEEALDLINKAAEVEPTFRMLKSTRGLIHLCLGLEQQALNDFNDSLAIKSDIGEAQYFRDLILSRACTFEKSKHGYSYPPYSVIQDLLEKD